MHALTSNSMSNSYFNRFCICQHLPNHLHCVNIIIRCMYVCDVFIKVPCPIHTNSLNLSTFREQSSEIFWVENLDEAGTTSSTPHPLPNTSRKLREENTCALKIIYQRLYTPLLSTHTVFQIYPQWNFWTTDKLGGGILSLVVLSHRLTNKLHPPIPR